ncbi:hypothetical protein [Serratia proteamaculans]|uniref:hypothetical protein n=1 Tax=Serratia proteamaculans TaxID=28151 RepID=UPI0029816E11|nr:hypothetical protein [Serratia proteamaculans]MDW5511769.1 hypothetical protein [Serratia proteamaculans]
MAKRKNNRAARALLCVSAPGPEDCFRISNRRRQVYSANYQHVWQHVKASRSQRRSKRLIEEMRIERHFWQNLTFGMRYADAHFAAVLSVNG